VFLEGQERIKMWCYFHSSHTALCQQYLSCPSSLGDSAIRT